MGGGGASRAQAKGNREGNTGVGRLKQGWR